MVINKELLQGRTFMQGLEGVVMYDEHVMTTGQSQLPLDVSPRRSALYSAHNKYSL